MPKVSAQHEQAVRARILEAALRVFAERGFHRATMQDIVRESGLSVGAIYTYFKGKDELILAGCDHIKDQEMGELRERIAAVTDYRQKIAVAVGFFFDGMDPVSAGGRDLRLLLNAWAEAETSPAIRAMLQSRRQQIVGVGTLLLQEGVLRGELPPWIDLDATAHALAAALDGIALEGIEEGAAYRRAVVERRALALVELVIAAAASPERPALTPVPPQPFATSADRIAS